jgi:hypothetical protein
MSNEMAIEAEIQAKGLTAPRLTPADIDEAIVAEYSGRASGLFHDTIPNQSLECLTICVLVLKNGYTVVGKSACASPENYDPALGHKIAREDARRQIWALEGYLLRSQLAADD